ncbi:hypothetical protein NFA_38110 [Nocardia farcinica IFM 10152]|uniref:Uncharacterized protein n=1 Tax=Nocardia farcinica (strain IFM 10152) TaxID=247156 RepID=Q5YT32_NOCFA|nr:hypothetical protein NFA_38110 [Nocardia farcinica IFM 10152]
MLVAGESAPRPGTPGPAGVDHSRNTHNAARRREVGRGGGRATDGAVRRARATASSRARPTRPNSTSARPASAVRIAAHRWSRSWPPSCSPGAGSPGASSRGPAPTSGPPDRSARWPSGANPVTSCRSAGADAAAGTAACRE